MSDKIELIERDGIVEVTFLDKVEASDAPDIISALANQLHGRLRLYEFAVDWSPDAEDIQAIASMAGKFVKIPDSKIAFVTSTSLGYGLARMYESYREFNGEAPPLKVFEDKSEAREWLKNSE